MAEGIQLVRILTQEDFEAFATISGDDNPIHVDAGFAKATRFGATVAHGMFLYSILEALASPLISGRAVRQTALMFPAPARLGDEIAFEAAETVAGQVDLTARRTSDSETVCKLTLFLGGSI